MVKKYKIKTFFLLFIGILQSCNEIITDTDVSNNSSIPTVIEIGTITSLTLSPTEIGSSMFEVLEGKNYSIRTTHSSKNGTLFYSVFTSDSTPIPVLLNMDKQFFHVAEDDNYTITFNNYYNSEYDSINVTICEEDFNNSPVGIWFRKKCDYRQYGYEEGMDSTVSVTYYNNAYLSDLLIEVTADTIYQYYINDTTIEGVKESNESFNCFSSSLISFSGINYSIKDGELLSLWNISNHIFGDTRIESIFERTYTPISEIISELE